MPDKYKVFNKGMLKLCNFYRHIIKHIAEDWKYEIHDVWGIFFALSLNYTPFWESREKSESKGVSSSLGLW